MKEYIQVCELCEPSPEIERPVMLGSFDCPRHGRTLYWLKEIGDTENAIEQPLQHTG